MITKKYANIRLSAVSGKYTISQDSRLRIIIYIYTGLVAIYA